MRDGLRKGELDLGRARQLGHAVLTVVAQAAKVSARTEIAAREARVDAA